MGTPVGNNAKKGKKNRKWYRNRVGRSSTALSQYRSRHNIPAGGRQANHITHACPIHDGRMTYDDHVKNFLRKQAIRLAAELEAKGLNPHFPRVGTLPDGTTTTIHPEN